MANRYMQQFYYSLTHMLTGIHGSINIASGTTGVSSQSLNGATAARTGVGEITITLGDKYPELLACDFKVQAATAQDLVPQIKSVDVVTAKTIVVRLLTGASPADPASAIVLYMNALLRNSSITK
jgi:hypothetical protein